MASSDNRSSFRLPWQSGNSSESDGDSAAGTAVADSPAWPSHDLARRQTRAAETAATPEQQASDATNRAAEMAVWTGMTGVTAEARAAAATEANAPVADPTESGSSEATATAEAMTADGMTADAVAADAVAADARTVDGAMTTTEETTAETTAADSTATATDVADTAETTIAATTRTTDTAASPAADHELDHDVDQTAPVSTSPDLRAEVIEAPGHGARDVAADARGRTSSKFLADLTRAMRQAADESRAAALAQFQADVDRHLAAARETCEGAAAEARRCADEDISALGEWETAEIARIRRETEEGITARHLRLEAELAGQVERLDAEMTRVDASVNGFSAEIDAFFNGLLQHEDPALFAAMAEQLPEPPTFVPWSADTMDWQPEPEGAEATAVDIWTEAEAGAAEAAGQASGAADMLADPETLPSDPNAGMPAMQAGDFAAAEAEAAAWGTEPMTAEADASTSTEADDAASTSDANHTGPWPPVSDARPAATTATKTQVAVVGLVSVASIATFKRLLARVPGIHGVQVGSGPDGEFLFNATHDESVDIREAVTGIQGFEIEVTDSGPGIVAARATDPESV